MLRVLKVLSEMKWPAGFPPTPPATKAREDQSLTSVAVLSPADSAPALQSLTPSSRIDGIEESFPVTPDEASASHAVPPAFSARRRRGTTFYTSAEDVRYHNGSAG